MTSVVVSVSAKGALELLSGIATRTRDPRPALAAIAADVRKRQQQVFNTGGRGAWAQLHPTTVERKGHARILIETSGLMDSFTSKGHAQHVEDISHDGLTVGSSHPLAPLHRDGTSRMPARNPMPAPTRGEQKRWADMLLRHLVGRR